MSSIIVMDRSHPGLTGHRYTEPLQYGLPDDRRSFWTGKYLSAGEVRSFMCEACGRIALCGGEPET